MRCGKEKRAESKVSCLSLNPRRQADVMSLFEGGSRLSGFVSDTFYTGMLSYDVTMDTALLENHVTTVSMSQLWGLGEIINGSLHSVRFNSVTVLDLTAQGHITHLQQ